MWSAEDEAALRTAAMAWLGARTNDGREALTRDEIFDFRFRGQPFKLMDPQRGIRKPQGFRAALSIRTTYRRDGHDRPYDDDMGDDGLSRYKWRGDDPEHPENRALRIAMRERVPLIWFWGVGQGVFQPIFPVFLVDEESAQQQFVVAADGMQQLSTVEARLSEVLRDYRRREVLARVHQPVFRSMVMRAYANRCCVCELGHLVLLDAAHIVEDRDERGIAAVRNGLSLCKIHHAAYDAGILGVSPDYRVHIRDDILVEIDGPLLEHGLKGLHGHVIRIPADRREQPDRDLLADHYQRFLAG